MQNEEHKFKSYKKTLKAKIVEFTAVRVSAIAAGNIGKMLKRMNADIEIKAAKNLSSVLTDERDRMVAKIEQNDKRYSYLSERSNIGQMPMNSVFDEHHNIKFENEKLKVEVKELNYKIKKLNTYVSARNLHITEADSIKSKLNGKSLEVVESMTVKAIVTPTPEEKTEEKEIKPIAEIITPFVSVEAVKKEINEQSKLITPAVDKKELISVEKADEINDKPTSLDNSHKVVTKPIEEPVTNDSYSEQDGLGFLTEVTKEIKKQKGQNAALTKTVEEKDKIITKVKEEKAIMQEAMQAAAVKAINERNELQAQNKQTQERLTAKTKENEQLAQQLKEANETVTLITGDRDKLQRENTDYQKSVAETTTNNQSLTAENRQLKIQTESQNAEIEKLTAEKLKALNELSRYKKAFMELRAAFETEQVSAGQETKQM